MDDQLLSIAAARELVLGSVPAIRTEQVAIEAALGRVLAEDVIAAHDVPPFASSAMDGIALRSGPADRRLTIAGESRAGSPFAGELADGEAIRISTGAAIPAGADAVLQLELLADEGDQVRALDEVAPGRNIRGAGEDLRGGERVLSAGDRIGAAALGVAINAGRGELRCAALPRVAVLATGDELVAPGASLGPGQIHDSNLLTLSALARESGAEIVLAEHVGDSEQDTRLAAQRALQCADLVVFAGGVSVGPHDHVKPALRALGVEQRFWRVALRPGKPTWFGVREQVLVLGLPGNPVSAMVTFLLFARPALAALQGAGEPPRRSARAGEALARHEQRDECVRVRLRDGLAYATGPQGSHVLRSMALADALAVVPRGEGSIEPGDPIELIEIGPVWVPQSGST